MKPFDKDHLRALEQQIDEYSGKYSDPAKYVKALWERSSYLSETQPSAREHEESTLRALEQIASHWSAELARIASRAESLRKMLSMGQAQQDAAMEDLVNFREGLQKLQMELEKQESEQSSEGLACLSDALARCPSRSDGLETVARRLSEIQSLAEGCVAAMVSGLLGEIPPVRQAIHEKWSFPSDHPPIAGQVRRYEGRVVEMNVASWNVLNQNYMKFIYKDTQGLDGSELVTLSEEERMERILSTVMQMLEHGSHPKHILCLQECWPRLLDYLKKKLLERGFVLVRTGSEEKNQEALIYDPAFVELLSFRCFRGSDAYVQSDPHKAITEALMKIGGKVMRIFMTHLPGAPYGTARRELCTRLKALKKEIQEIPTLLMGDLNFPDEAVAPLLRHLGELEDVHFLQIPYPTNVGPGSLLPKRIDALVSLASRDRLEVVPLEPEEVLPEMTRVVNLLLEVQRSMPEPLGAASAPSAEGLAERLRQLATVEARLHEAKPGGGYVK